MREPILRRLTESDLPAADELRRLAGWNQTPEKWRSLLRIEPHGCFAAEQNGLVIGTVTTTTYGQPLAWIGMMLVHPDHRRRGIGTRLMHQALGYLQAQGVHCIQLDATPAGQHVYERLGFIAESTLTRWQRTAASKTGSCEASELPESPVGIVNPGQQAFGVPPSGGLGAADRLGPELRTSSSWEIDAANVRQLADVDWTAVNEIDAAAFGASRVHLLRSLAKLSRSALVWPTQGGVRGWGMLRPGANADYLGPLVCRSAEGSVALLAALLGAAENRPVVWDILDQNESARAAAQRFGFAPLRSLTRMRLGPDSIAGDSRAQFAIADPAVG